MTEPANITVRLKTAADQSMVYDSWIRSYRKAPATVRIPANVYSWWQRTIVDSVWVDPTSTILVAVDPADPTRIFGWLAGQVSQSLAGDQRIVHYVYVKAIYRRFGVASRLLRTFLGETDLYVTTHDTVPGRDLLRAYKTHHIYNPYLAWARAPALGSKVPKRVLARKDADKALRRRLPGAAYVAADDDLDDVTPEPVAEGGPEGV
jgi:GNAT superfamily N-acetyltransferase